VISLVIPAYNEAGRIQSTVREAVHYFGASGRPFEIIVSADGTDGTREAARALCADHPQIKVIGSDQRRGKGNGIRQAVQQATGTIIGFSDADNKTPITEFDKFAPLLDQGYEVVIGSRGLEDSQIEQAQPLYRRLGSRGFALFMQAAVGLPGITDSQCGFKFFQGDVARDLFRHQQIDGYMFDVEILYIARQRGYRVQQVPVRWRDDADSRLDLISGNLKNVRDILSIRWRHRQLPDPVERPAEGGLSSGTMSGSDL
jgi:glycosyltransferase involved in cell wall biosynthesis